MSRRISIALAVLGAPVLFAACGSEEDFENQPRASAPVELTAKVNDKEVEVSPGEVGAGLVVFTISNQSRVPVQLTFAGPPTTDSPGEKVPSSREITPNGVSEHKVDLAQGEYTIGAGDQSDARKAVLDVGPERPSSTNDLLLP